MKITSKLSKLIKRKEAKVAIIGIGYVGSALAWATFEAGFDTLGIDIDQKKISTVNKLRLNRYKATQKFNRLAECDIICICVPTSVDQYKRPHLEILKEVALRVSQNLRSGQLIIIESSVAPGITRNLVLPILLKSKLRAEEDFFLAYSPERVDPGNPKFNTKNTPKIVSGLGENSLELAWQFYASFVKKVISVSSLEVAEMTKIFENVFRFVNISLVNEMAVFTKALDIDIWEVINAASTKPYGFLAHYPGPGVGGDCIPVLPYHLLDAANRSQITLRITQAAAEVNELQPQRVVQKAIETINGKTKKNGYNPKVLLIGVSYKENIADIRQSPALEIWKVLEKLGMSVSYHDPYVPRVNGSTSCKITANVLTKHDLIIITTAHNNIPYDLLVKSKKPVIDTRNILSEYRQPHIIKL